MDQRVTSVTSPGRGPGEQAPVEDPGLGDLGPGEPGGEVPVDLGPVDLGPGDRGPGGRGRGDGPDEVDRGGRAVGVGPWPGGPATWPALDVDGRRRYDPELLAHGDRRNVVDAYRYWTVEAIVADLDTRRHPLHVAIENWVHDLNIGSVVRTANAVNVAGVHVVGRRRWNRRGAMVTDRYVHVHHHPDVAGLASWAASAGLPLLGVDNVPGAVPLEGYPLPRSCVLLLGQESVGLSPEAVDACAAVLSIAQFGSTRSINAGAAAAIAMHAWVVQHAGPPDR